MTHRSRPGLGHALGVLQHRDFSLFYAALVVATMGGQLQAFANTLQIYDLTRSPFHIGLTGLARAIPLIGLSLVGGVVADRIDRRILIIVTQAISGGLALVLAGLTATGLLEVWHIYAVTLVGSALMAVSAPARSAMIPNLVPREHLMNAIALNSSTWQLANIVGPTIAGFSVASSGYAPTYVANAGAHIVTVLCLLVMHPRPIAGRSHQGAFQSIKEGLVFVRHRSIILALLGMDAAAMVFGAHRVVLPVIGEQLGLDAAGIGLLFAAPGVGSLAGAALIMSVGNIRYKGLLVVGALLAYCAALALLALSPWFWLALLASGALGLTDALQATPRNALIQTITPDEIRGRVEAFRHMLTGGMPALGQMYMGGTASVLGAPLALLVGAGACAAVVLGITAARADVRAADVEAEPASRPVPAGAR